MTLVPLDIPAGFYRNGTDLEQTGRWRDGSLVRWRDNSLRPVKGWQTRKASFASNTLRGMHSWEANDGTASFAIADSSGAVTFAGVVTGPSTATLVVKDSSGSALTTIRGV